MPEFDITESPRRRGSRQFHPEGDYPTGSGAPPLGRSMTATKGIEHGANASR